MGNINTREIEEKKYDEMATLKAVEQLPTDTCYYANEYCRKGRYHMYWTTFYNANFEEIGAAKVAYANALNGIKRIVRAADSDRPELLAYKLTPLNDDFFLVSEQSDTETKLKSISKSFN